MAHLPFDPAKLAPGDLALYREMVEERRSVDASFPRPYAALMNHPQLAKRISDLGFFLNFQGRLPREIYQFVVLAVSRYANAAFEWMDHFPHARAAGLPETIIETLRQDGIAKQHFPPPFDTAARVLMATLPWTQVPQDVQDQAIAQFGMEGFVELVVLSGFYQMFATINQGFGVALPDGASAPF